MEIELIIAISIFGFVIGYIIGCIFYENSIITIEDLEKEYNTGYRFGYNDALDDIEIDLKVNLEEYRDIPEEYRDIPYVKH